MKTFVLVAAFALGCTGGTTATPDAETPQQCEADFQAVVVKTCMVMADCALVGHDDCCGTTELGVSVTDRGVVEVAESHYDACVLPGCGARGCASATRAEDGQVPMGNQTIVPACVMGMCTSVVQ